MKTEIHYCDVEAQGCARTAQRDVMDANPRGWHEVSFHEYGGSYTHVQACSPCWTEIARQPALLVAALDRCRSRDKQREEERHAAWNARRMKAAKSWITGLISDSLRDKRDPEVLAKSLLGDIDNVR